MTSDTDRAQWRREFASWGHETTRLRVVNPWYQMTDECRREGEAWLREQDAIVEARDKGRYRELLWWTIAGVFVGAIAAVASVIAAYTVLR